MAKQPRSKPSGKPARESAGAGPAAPAASRGKSAPPAVTPPPAPQAETRRSTYVEAVALYERGLEAMQRHDFKTAASVFESVLARFPEEKELLERARLYLNVCSRQVAPAETSPKGVRERLYAATLAINGERYDEALVHLRLVRDEDPDNDHALYMLAVAHAQRGEHAEAMAHLARAIALNPENRSLAKRDPDLQPLQEDEVFRAVLSGPIGGAGHLAPPPRPKASR